MSKHGRREPNVQCPYFHATDDYHYIMCDSWASDRATNRIYFQRWADYDLQMRVFCEDIKGWHNCELARILNEYNDAEEEKT